MGHIPPPYCAPDVLIPFVYTDDPLVADIDKAKAIHRNELDDDVTTESDRRGLIATPIPSTDIPAVADQTVWQKDHLDELKAAIEYMNNPGEAPNRSCPLNSDAYCVANTNGWCPTDSVGPTLSWTNPTITSDETLVQAVDVEDRRSNLNLERVSCICEQEACNFCSDCGHYYTSSSCSDSPCRCDDHQSPECACQQTVAHWDCALINQPSSVVWSDLPIGVRTAPWNCMCNYTPPGISWTTYSPPHAPGNWHLDWGCMCNPYTWG